MYVVLSVLIFFVLSLLFSFVLSLAANFGVRCTNNVCSRVPLAAPTNSFPAFLLFPFPSYFTFPSFCRFFMIRMYKLFFLLYFGVGSAWAETAISSRQKSMTTEALETPV